MDEAILAQLLVLGALVHPVEELDLGAGHQLGPRLPSLELLTVDPHGFEVEENQTIFLRMVKSGETNNSKHNMLT